MQNSPKCLSTGTGKTTRARELYQDIRSTETFGVHAWVTMSRAYKKRNLLIDVLQSSSLIRDGDTVGTTSDQQLGERLCTRLKDKKYLIVIDNTMNWLAWDGLRQYLPDQCNGSTIISVSNFGMIKEASATHDLQPLPFEKSWELFQNKVFGNQNSCPRELEALGKEIIRNCQGLPLAIVLTCGLLAKKDKTAEFWKHVAKKCSTSPPETSVLDDSNNRLSLLCYKYLPLHLKACFLYIGLFPPKCEFLVCSLVWMLIAEGFVIQEVRRCQEMSLEVIAQGYVDELVDRGLLMVSRKRSDGSTKACHVPDILRKFILEEAGHDNFLQYQDMDRMPRKPNLDCRRLSISDIYALGRFKNPGTPHLRSLMFSCKDYFPLKVPTVFHEDEFKLLKVLDLLSNKNISFPSKIGTLFHLKYLALWSEVAHLPSSFTDLSNLETLVLNSKETVTFPNGIWKMVKLSHVFNKIGLFHFEQPNSNNSFSSLDNLQTLSRLCSCKSCIELLARTPRITKLGLSGDLISESGCLIFPALDLLKQLETFKLVNTSKYSRSLADFLKPMLSNSLKRLTLQNTFLKWEEISALGSLENLVVLKLLHNAYVGSDWDSNEHEFPQLKYLRLQNLDMVNWVDHDMQFQNLEVLVLDDCVNLLVLPTGLAQLPQLGLIEVTRCNQSVEKLARKIVQRHKQQCGDDKLRTVIVSDN